MNYEGLDTILPDDETHKVENLKKGESVRITTDEGEYDAVVACITTTILGVHMLEPLTSNKAHSHHWAKGDFKTILFKRLIKIQKLT